MKFESFLKWAVSLFTKALIMLIRKLNVRLLESTFISVHKLGDSHKLSSSIFGIKIICNVYTAVCFHFVWKYGVFVWVCVYTLKGLTFVEVNFISFLVLACGYFLIY